MDYILDLGIQVRPGADSERALVAVDKPSLPLGQLIAEEAQARKGSQRQAADGDLRPAPHPSRAAMSRQWPSWALPV